jgi:hypothetical protein
VSDIIWLKVMTVDEDELAWRNALFLIDTGECSVWSVMAVVRQREALPGVVRRDIRDARLTNVEVGGEAGVDASYVSRLRHGRPIPHTKLLQIQAAVGRIVAARGERETP